MTEDEAKTKWCPMTLGRTPPNPEACGGSACMAWRESPPPPEIVGPIHGFCGLAGIPA